MVASNQFAMPAMSYYMWTQHWPITELKQIDREARKLYLEKGGKHPSSSTPCFTCHVIKVGEECAPSRQSIKKRR